MSTLADVRALGFQVSAAITLIPGQPSTYYVKGFGIETYVREDDQAAIDGLADPVVHANRKLQYENPSLRLSIL